MSVTLASLRRRLSRYHPWRLGQRLRKRLDPSLRVDENTCIAQLFGDSGADAVMVDVGMHFGESAQVFLERGWTVHGFEPDPENRARIAPHPRLHLIDKAITETDGEQLTLYRSEVSSGISSLSAFHASHRAAATVETTRLDTYLQAQGLTRVDYLKVDAEGHDLFVLRSFPWAEHTPRIVLCEFEDLKTTPLGYSYHDLATLLTGRGYHVVLSEWYPIVRYGTSHRWRALHDYPCTLAEPRAWGNVIAFQDPQQAAQLRSMLP